MDRIKTKKCIAAIQLSLLFITIISAQEQNKEDLNPVFPLKRVELKISINAQGYDLVKKEHLRPRNDTNIYFIDNFGFTCNVMDGNLEFWENLMKTAKIEPMPEDYLKGKCMCVCSEAVIVIKDSKQQEYNIEYQNCSKMDLIGKRGKKEILIKQNNEGWNALDDHIKHVFATTLNRFEIK